MAPRRTLVVILAGGAGGRLDLLTRSRAKPAVPFGGMYRLVDFPLSNCLHSGLPDVWVIEQFNPVSLTDHLANGRPWDLDRTSGGLLVLHPRLGEGAEGWHQGTADALWRNASLIREFGADSLVVLSADAVYRLDYAALVERHVRSGATVTMVTTRVPRADAGRYGVVEVDDDGRVTGYRYKPDEPATDLVTNEVFVFEPAALLDLLEELAGDDGEDAQLEDLGHEVLPRLVAEGGAREVRFDDYWRDVGLVDSYWSAHMDLVTPEPPFLLEHPGWPILTTGGRRGPAEVRAGAELVDVVMSPGVRLGGHVERSVLSPGVVIEPGAVVRDSVLLHDVVVESGAVVERAVLDAGVRVSRGARVGGPRPAGADDLAIALVGQGEVVAGDASLAPGQRLPDDGRAS
jgi:glucose-1-phosphate adenylyltransferase